MPKSLGALIVEDSEDDALLTLRELQRGGFEVTSERVDTAAAMRAALARRSWDVVISDHAMPRFSGLAALQVLKDSGLDLPFIIVSGAIGEDVAVEAMRRGAHDYLIKGQLVRLVPAVERELREAEIRRQRRQAEEDLRRAHDELEQRVAERTRELALANEELRREMAERKEIARQRDELLQSERIARAAAERASQLKDEFVATVSHELRNPLNSMIGWTQLLRRGAGSPQDTAEALDIIASSGRALTELVDDLLDMSRIISGKLRLNIQTVDPASIIGAALEVARPAAEARGIRLEATLDPAAGPVRADPNRLQQVVWNLLSNAVKFTDRGGRVEVTLAPAGSQVVISVADTGRGIDPDFLPHIFERFRQEDASAARKHGGLGIGLSIVHQLVALHGGTVQATSPGKDRGATFIVTLPVPPVAPLDEPTARCPPHAADRAVIEHDNISLAGVKVLAVDDERESRELLKRVLEERQAQVCTAASAADALELLQRFRPDVLVSDIGMPAEDGYELMRRVRALPPESGGATPAIALTAFAGTEHRQRAILAGYQAHVAKPVEVLSLILTIVGVVGRMPCSPPAEARRARPAETAKTQRAEPSQRAGRSVLVVEDHPRLGALIVRMLREEGFTAERAATVAAALELLNARRFDVLLCDRHLPDGDGCELMRAALRERPIKGIAVSGLAREEDVRESRAAGFVEHLPKPASAEDILAAIDRALKE